MLSSCTHRGNVAGDV